jgi:hypothetical protein
MVAAHHCHDGGRALLLECSRPLGVARTLTNTTEFVVLGSTDPMSVTRLDRKWLVKEAGGSLDNVARIVAYVTEVEDREPVNGLWWEELFPDRENRPAYK